MLQQQNSYIVFQCYGNESIFHECAYALLTLSQHYKPEDLGNVQICIYTDKPEWFQSFRECWLPVFFRKMDDALIQQWKGEIDFVHRVKIEILRDFTLRKGGNILYADTDIVFLQRMDHLLREIQSGKLFMHVSEGVVSEEGNPIMRKLSFYLRDQQIIKETGKPLCDAIMWNAGVLGFNTQHNALLDNALFFTDMVYPQFPKHVVEQYAFSLYFQRADTIHAAAPYILHYWNVKEIRKVLASFFEYFKASSWDDLVKYSRLIQLHVAMQEKISFLKNRSVMDKFRKEEWEPAIPDWKLLSQQL